MEHVEGTRLDRWMGGRALATDLAVRVAIQIARAVSHAHARGVLHLDLKPSNVLLSASARSKVIDFGVAGHLAAMREDATRATDPVLGTPAYMAPEQWSSDSPDGRADVWALGVMLFEMVTGKLPCWAGTIRMRRDDHQVWLGQLEQHVGAPLCGTIASALAWERDARFSIEEMLVALLAVRRCARSHGLRRQDLRRPAFVER
jgi:serine/threonine protein kinase